MASRRRHLFPQFLLVLISTSVFITACSKEKEIETVFPQQKLQCQKTEVKKQYIVHLVSGVREVVRGLTREEVIKQVIEPRRHEILRVDYDQYLEKTMPVMTSAAAPALNWGLTAANVEPAWSRNIRGQNVVVAVVDSAMDVDHHLLRNQLFTNPGEDGVDDQGFDKRTNGKDDDGNGYVDDYAGYDFSFTPANDFDSRSHATHVAGIIAAEHNLNQVSTSSAQGVAPQAKILPVGFLGPNGGTISDALNALDYAALRGAHIVNASWGGGCAPAIKEKVDELGLKGILFVAASGNEGVSLDRFEKHPASFNLPLQITVGSISPAFGPPPPAGEKTKHDMSSFSNYSRNVVHIFAPGFDILSTLPGGNGTNTGLMRGTSMATPFVSGALALLKSHRPHASSEELRQALLSGVVTNKDYLNSTSGRLDIEEAIEALEQLVP